MNVEEFEKQNEDFLNWMADIGKLAEACSNGKTYMVNPKAMTTLMTLSKFFKCKSDEHMAECKKYRLEGKPYTIKTLPTKPWLKEITLAIMSNDVDEIAFSVEDIKFLHETIDENVTMIFGGGGEIGSDEERFKIWFEFKNYFIEMKE